nr:MAG TPA: hypothetical protein [Herelleviridae sp.]
MLLTLCLLNLELLVLFNYKIPLLLAMLDVCP